MPVVSHFLIVFDHAQQRLVSVAQYADAKAAVRAYSDAEARHRNDEKLEIVLVSADSIDTIHTTHGHYFTDERPASKYLRAVM